MRTRAMVAIKRMARGHPNIELIERELQIATFLGRHVRGSSKPPTFTVCIQADNL